MVLSRRQAQRRRGAVLVEYGLLIGGVALIAVAAISILGHKTNDLFSTVAASLPGAHPDDNAPIQSGKLVETAVGPNGAIAIDAQGIANSPGTPRLANNLGIPEAALEALVVEPADPP